MAKKRGKRANHEGTLYQRKDGRWYAQITLPDGSRQGFYANSEAEALQRKQEALATIAKGLPLPDEKLTLGAWLKEWIASVSNVRQSSWKRYETVTRVHLLNSSLSRQALVKLTKQQVLAFYKQKQQAGLAPATIRQIHVVLSRALREAQEDHRIPYNVCQRLRVAQPDEHEMLYLSRAQVQQFLDSVRSHRSFALFALALVTGMRQGELLGLRWRDLDLDTPKPCLQVRLQSVLVREPGHHHYKLDAPKTKRSRRRIYIGSSVVQVLRAHEARQKLEKRMAGENWQGRHSLVFPNSIGGLADHAAVYKLFVRLAEKAGLPEEIRFHDMRHTAATLALESGESIKAVAEMLGDTEAMVMRVYAHVTPRMEASLTATMDSLLAPFQAPLQYPLQSDGEEDVYHA